MIKHLILFLINHFFPSFLFRTKRNKLVVDSFQGKPYSGNGKYVVDELLKYNKNLDVVWLDLSGKQSSIYPSGVRVVKYNSLQSVYELATAKIWIDDFRKKYFPPKKKNQKYIQLWHGSVTLKKVEKDIISELDGDYLKEAQRDGGNVDFMISGNANSTRLYKKKFWLSGKVLEYGTPRLDPIINYNGLKLQSWARIPGLDDQDHVLLYAPTFRDDTDMAFNIYHLPFEQIKVKLESTFGGTWKILIRLHPNIIKMQDKLVEEENVIGVSNFPDAQDLILRSDILITDYSSIMFDAMYAKKPVLLYVPDLENYNKSRGMYFDLSNLPFFVAKNTLQLVTGIVNFKEDSYQKDVDLFKKAIGSVEDGKASKKTAQFVLNLLEEN